MTATVMYRYEDRREAALFDDEGRYPGTVRIALRRYHVLRETPKGAWIETGLGQQRFVLRGARRRFACPSVAEARASFIARKRAQIRIYRARLQQAEQALAAIAREEAGEESVRSA